MDRKQPGERAVFGFIDQSVVSQWRVHKSNRRIYNQTSQEKVLS